MRRRLDRRSRWIVLVVELIFFVEHVFGLVGELILERIFVVVFVVGRVIVEQLVGRRRRQLQFFGRRRQLQFFGLGLFHLGVSALSPRPGVMPAVWLLDNSSGSGTR